MPSFIAFHPITLLTQVTAHPRFAVATAVRDALKLSATVKKLNADDAGLVDYGALDPSTLWDLRLLIGATLDAAKPPPKNKLVDLRTPPRDVSKLPTIGAIRS